MLVAEINGWSLVMDSLLGVSTTPMSLVCSQTFELSITVLRHFDSSKKGKHGRERNHENCGHPFLFLVDVFVIRVQ